MSNSRFSANSRCASNRCLHKGKARGNAGQMKLNAASHGHLAMLAFSALIAGSFSLGSLVANEIAPAALNAVRFLLAAVIIGALGAATGVLNRAVARAPWRYLILGGLFATYFVLMFEGLKTAPQCPARRFSRWRRSYRPPLAGYCCARSLRRLWQRRWPSAGPGRSG